MHTSYRTITPQTFMMMSHRQFVPLHIRLWNQNVKYGFENLPNGYESFVKQFLIIFITFSLNLFVRQSMIWWIIGIKVYYGWWRTKKFLVGGTEGCTSVKMAVSGEISTHNYYFLNALSFYSIGWKGKKKYKAILILIFFGKPTICYHNKCSSPEATETGPFLPSRYPMI